MNEQINQYKQDSVNTASPEQLTLMLYRAALAGVEEYRQHIIEDPGKGLDLSKATRDVLAGLADNVNMQHPHGPTMRDLYLFCWRTSLSSATNGTTEGLDSVEAILRNLIAGLEEFQHSTRLQPVDAKESESINFAG